ncbi:hypothetical protein H5410_054771 [Solanum commersonii]|uniref:Uncharacterized protein n=1 Tax=Solanum commersonii TaxID=4109 RepID=A0A9J5WGQ3_SOLCO|nr:hypothetical protein H5410_054771 [Solanum commersonii]
MTISLEALAMSGGDYIKDGISMEEFEKYEEQVPPYLLIDEDDEVFFKKTNMPQNFIMNILFVIKRFIDVRMMKRGKRDL